MQKWKLYLIGSFQFKSSGRHKALLRLVRVKSGNLGHQINSDIHLRTVEIQMRRLLMSRFIKIFTVCLVNFVLFH